MAKDRQRWVQVARRTTLVELRRITLPFIMTYSASDKVDNQLLVYCCVIACDFCSSHARTRLHLSKSKVIVLKLDYFVIKVIVLKIFLHYFLNSFFLMPISR